MSYYLRRKLYLAEGENHLMFLYCNMDRQLNLHL